MKLFALNCKFNMPWWIWLLSLCSLTMLAAHYPLIVACAYVVLQIFNYFNLTRENKFTELASVLPVRRKDIVRTIVGSIVLFEAVMMAGIAVCTAVRLAYAKENAAGIDGNFTFIAMCFLCLGAFNVVFCTKYFKTGFHGKAILWGLLSFLAMYLVVEIPVQTVPTLTKVLEGFDTQWLWLRALLAVLSAAFCVVATVAVTKKSYKNFEKVSL